MKRISRITWFLLLAVLICSVTLFSACANGITVVELPDEVGWSLFNIDSTKNDINVIFFDDDNLVSQDGTSFAPCQITSMQNSIRSSDCYMIQSGDCEILVDAGHQMPSVGEIQVSALTNHITNEILQNDVKMNLLRKIATVMSDDGVLDYLIVTHADFDHIASLIVTGGIFDAFLNDVTVTDLNGRQVEFDRIKYIIDFDSGLVRHFSNTELVKEARLISSKVYEAYVIQRDNLIEKDKTGYCPAAAFFDYDNLSKANSDGIDESIKTALENKITTAMPNTVEKELSKKPNSSLDLYILDESKQSNSNVNKVAKSNGDFSDSQLLEPENGNLVIEGEGDQISLYYKLHFNNSELRILYNWHYDYIMHQSFNREVSSDETSSDMRAESYDAQDANNISVCFEVVKDNFKFLSLGDLGANGEDGLLKYYADTNVLSDVSLFKASHHGSTANKGTSKEPKNENGKDLLLVIKPRIIVVTGCAQVKPGTTEIVNQAMNGTTKVEQQFFDNIFAAYNDKDLPYVMYTNINTYTFDTNYHFRSMPFYGDIKVRFDGRKVYLSYSYVGQVKGYVKQDVDQCVFTTRDDKNKFLSVCQTEWFKQINEHIWES